MTARPLKKKHALFIFLILIALLTFHPVVSFAFAEKVPGENNKTVEDYKQDIKVNLDDAEAHYNLGTAYSNSGRYKEAAWPLEQAIRLKPDYAETYYNLGAAYSKLEMYKEKQ